MRGRSTEEKATVDIKVLDLTFGSALPRGQSLYQTISWCWEIVSFVHSSRPVSFLVALVELVFCSSTTARLRLGMYHSSFLVANALEFDLAVCTSQF